MPDQKTHRITLGEYSEEVSDQELAAIQERYKRNFPYVVEPLQPARPADGPAPRPALPAPAPTSTPA